MEEGKCELVSKFNMVDLNFVAATCRTFGHTMRFDATRLLALILSQRSVARIQTSLNSCDRSQRQKSVAATMIFTCHTMPSTYRLKLSLKEQCQVQVVQFLIHPTEREG